MARKFITSLSIEDLSSPASQALGIKVAGDTSPRLIVEAGGKILWGGGASAGDTTLYRFAENHLKSDDAFEASGGLITITTDGTPVASLPNGALAVDNTNNKLYFRSNDTWQDATGGGSSVTVSETAPLSASEGDLWFESDTGDIFVYYDSVWVDIGGSSVANIAMSDTPPANPTNGDFWFETDTARTFVYYNDGTSSQWVEIGVASVNAAGNDGYVQYYSGGILAGASALYYDEVNDRVGIKNLSPAYDLDVAGTIGASTIYGNLVGDATGNASTASKWATARTITLGTDASGSVTFDGSANVTLDVTVADDSHNHIISNVDGLQTALDAKLDSSSYTASDVLTKIKTVDGAGSGLDADLLDGNDSSAFATSAQGALADSALQTSDIGVSIQAHSSVLDATTASFTTEDKTKLDSLGSGGAVDSVNSQTGVVVLDADDIDDTSTTNKFTTSADISKLAGIEAGATADQTASEILTAIKTVDGAGSGLDADTLDGVQGDSYALKTYVDTAVSNLVDAAPATLDTLNELAAALGDDPNFATTIATSIGLKQDAATALTTSTTFGGDVSGTYNAIVIADDSHNHITSNIDGLEEYIEDIVAGSLTAGSQITVTYDDNANTITVAHADTSTQASVNNSNGTVIQDVTVDGNGHITALGSVDLDGRYFTETETDARFLRKDTSDTMSGTLTVTGGLTVDTNTLYVDNTNNRVGIGTTSPDVNLHVADGTSGVTTHNPSSKLIVESSGNAAIEIATPANAVGYFRFVDTGSSAAGGFSYDHTTDTLAMRSAGTDRVTIDSSGNVGIGTTSPLFPLQVNGDIYSVTAAFIAGYVDANNVDHLWHDDATNSWNFCSDTTYKAAGNSTLKAAALTTTGAVTSGGLTVDTNTLHVDATNNRVGIGTTSPQDPFHVQSGSSGFAGAYNARTVSIFESNNSAGTVISIMSPATGYSGIFFGDNSGEAAGQLKYNHATDGFEFYGASATRMELTSDGSLVLPSNTPDVINFTATSTDDARGIAFNSRTALSADHNDGWLRLNNASEFTNGVYTPGNLRVDGILRIDDTRGLTNVTASYGTVQTTGAGLGGWEGYSIDGWAVFMADSSTGNFGLYDDVNNQWGVLCDFNGWVRLHYAGATKLETRTDGVAVIGTLTADAKSFDIPHPTKDGHRLQYGSVEAPEHSVQVRGRCTDSVIQLPDYWIGLVDPDSITVQLTAVGRPQTLYVESWDATKVEVGGDNNKDFFYTVSAERIDIEKLVVEYVESE